MKPNGYEPKKNRLQERLFDREDLKTALSRSWGKGGLTNGWDNVTVAAEEYFAKMIAAQFYIPDRPFDRCGNCGWSSPHKCVSYDDEGERITLVWSGYDV